ncbi:PHD finger protein EHD3 [Vitis vinifera]|uniref:PHD finger protein EHD3 n=1 Tax=Vitis vinifera TaxID=29760 RepID=A0A438K3J7_VITVI|nr:PHD finger protein EHD3 [Vitis vinifera]
MGVLSAMLILQIFHFFLVWKKLQRIGTEIVSLGTTLSEMSRTSYSELVEGAVLSASEDGKNEKSDRCAFHISFLKGWAAFGVLERVDPGKVSKNHYHFYRGRDSRLVKVLYVVMALEINGVLVEGDVVVCTRESDSHTKLEQLVACGVFKVCSCRHCGEKADGRDCLVCDSCEEVYHISCVEPAVKVIPHKSWYCVDCIASRLPHENCVVCKKLNAQRTLINGVGDDIISMNEETDMELEESSNCITEVGIQQQKETKYFQLCKICGSDMEFGEHLLECGHPFCPNKYYHKSCLTSTELRMYGPCWYCPSCLCRACLTDRDDEKIILCDGCDHAYHIYCMNPPRTSIPRGKWFCRKCDADIQKIRKAKMVFEDLERERKQKGEQVIDKDEEGPMDILLNAAQTLNLQEELAAIRMDSLVEGPAYTLIHGSERGGFSFSTSERRCAASGSKEAGGVVDMRWRSWLMASSGISGDKVGTSDVFSQTRHQRRCMHIV